jgi:hypothetical protein
MNNQVTDMSHLTVPQLLSNGDRIDYSLKEASMSVLCDFMDCQYKCNYTEQEATIDSKVQVSRTMEQIRQLFQNGYVYEKKELYDALQLFSPISYTQLHESLSQMIDLKMECRDMIHRKGYIVNFGTYYMFQPENLPETIPVYERRIPVNKTKHSIIIEPHTFEKRTNVQSMLEEFEKNGGNLKALGAEIKKLGLKVPSVIGLWNAIPGTMSEFELSLKETRRRMRMAHDIGAEHIQTIPNTLPENFNQKWVRFTYIGSRLG